MVKDNPYSFLHIDKAEIDLPKGTDIYSDEVYRKAKENLENLEKTGALIQDKKPCFYIYRQIMNGRSQTGIVGCASIDDYANGVIKKHENTRAEKEADRIHHVDTCNAQTGPIFLAYRSNKSINEVVDRVKSSDTPVYDFVADDGIRHCVWVIDKDADIASYDRIFLGFPIWWYVAPTIINTFLESYDFTGKTIILFATSGGSGFGKTVQSLKESCPGAVIQEGKMMNGSPSPESLKEWVENL